MTVKIKSELSNAISRIEEAEGRHRDRSELDRIAGAEDETEAHRKPFEMFGSFSSFSAL